MTPIWSYQPLKALWTAWIIGIAPVYFLLLSLYYIPQRLRPHPKWTSRTALGRAFYYRLFEYATEIRMAPDYAAKEKGPDKRFVMDNPSSSDLYTGVLKHSSIKPVPFGAIWFPRAPTSDDIQSRRVILHLPGGAYVIASPPSRTGIFPSKVYSISIDALTFYAQYRVAASPDSRFPAAPQDAVTFYAYLLDLGISAKNIIISGDSAGGNLVIALIRYVKDAKNLLPHPRGAIAWSPWVNMTTSAVSRYKASTSNSTDLVPYQILEWGLEAYPPSAQHTSDKTEAYISPAQHPFATRTPLVVQAGSVEVFRDDIAAFAKDMTDIFRNKVKYFETPLAPHDLILCGGILAFVDEAIEAVRAADEFFQG